MKDFPLSEHFSFFEFTVTSNAELQETNREEAMQFVPSLKASAALLKVVRAGRGLVVNSGFRSWKLNKATKGSSPTSQHPKGQAVDFHRPGEDPHTTFQDVLERLRASKVSFGQLIDESADRGYKNADGTEAISRWVHLSLGADFWIPERCGEVLRKWDENGTARFELLEKISMGGK